MGHNAYSCDLSLGEKGLPNHLQCDVREILKDGWDMMIAFPPCTYLANSGVRWLSENRTGEEAVKRYHKMLDAAVFFNQLLEANIPRICVENPIQHKYARECIRKYDQIIQPYYFGDAESKATCLWLKNLPPLIFKFTGGEGIKQSVFREPPSPERQANRSRTFRGIAEAMAEQWGRF
jgi:hypothetical protein